MHAWEAIDKVLDTIEQDLDETLDIGALAWQAALSPFYFQRLFRRLVGCPVGEYVRLRRLARSAGWLAKGDKVVDVAVASGFDSHEGYTRAFKAAYGITPESYRKNPVVLNHYEKPALELNYVLVDEGVPLVAEGVVLEVNRCCLENDTYLLGLARHISIATNTPAGRSTGADSPGEVWEAFHTDKDSFTGLLPGGLEWGISLMDNEPEGCFTYFAGAEAEPDAVPTVGQTVKILEKGEYIALVIEAESKEELVTAALNKAINYLFQTWLPRLGQQVEPWSAERYLTPDGDVYRMELWVKPLPAAKD